MLHFLLTVNTILFSAVPQTPKFTEQILDNNISIGYGLAVADVDGDKRPDILLADKKQFVWYRNGDWKKFVMAENLTEFDNVCIAARDIDGDGKAEVAVGAQWNPGETSDDTKSGAVFFLKRPADPTKSWPPVKLQHEPTVHRMRWVKSEDEKFYLIVLPLHGRGNKNGEGEGVRAMAYAFPGNGDGDWNTFPVDESMHLTHNLDATEGAGETDLFIGGKEGVMQISDRPNSDITRTMLNLPGMEKGVGELRVGKLKGGAQFLATILPMHGNELAVYSLSDKQKVTLDNSLREGHALASGDFTSSGSDQVVAGWRIPDKDGKVGIKLYSKKGAEGREWVSQWIDDNGMACEDIQVADLNKDGKPDIIASGRATHNVKIYWNK
jgi:hypothetical protein